MVAKAVQVTAVQPFDFFRTIRQAVAMVPETQTTHLLRTPWQVMRSDGEGIRSMWRGFIPSLLRDVPAAGCYWWGYNSLSAALLKDLAEEEPTNTRLQDFMVHVMTYCQPCLRQWTITKLDDGAPSARCPSSCGSRIDHRLPNVSKVLSRMLEASHPEELEQRRREDEEEDEVILGGYAAWQEVAASRDIKVGERVMIACGTSGIVLCNHETTHIKVKFDASLHGTGTVNVFVEDLMSQLPRNPLGLKIGDAVVAAMNLETGPVVAVPFGTYGTVLGAGQEGRIQVRFNASDKEPAKCLSVQSFELQPAKELVGGFRVAQRVKASVDIRAEETVLVQLGTYGTVLGEYSDTRLVVRFDQRMDGLEQAVNLGPGEIEAA
eukprot:symbB.v1.2.000965.t1/scaffold39.1/size394969/9